MKTGILVVKSVAVLLNCLLLVLIGHGLWKGRLMGGGTEKVLLLSFYCALPIINLIAILLPPLASKSNR